MRRAAHSPRAASLVVLLAYVAMLMMTASGASAYDGPRGSRRDKHSSCLLLDADICPGNHTLTCLNSVEDVVCVHDRNSTGECPSAEDLDQVERECGAFARPHACLLPADATECSGNTTLTCANSEGETVCFKAFNTTECPEAEELDDVERVCLDCNRSSFIDEERFGDRRPRGNRGLLADGPRGNRRDKHSSCLLLDADICPGNHTLTCLNSVEDVVCVHDRNSTGECPSAEDLDQVEHVCGAFARPHACLLQADATECSGNTTLTCANSAGETVCFKAFNITECPEAEELDDVERVCRDCNRSLDSDRLERPIADGQASGLTGDGFRRSGRGGRRMML